ncbi:hypothetical protein BDM02DRAFT_1374405 [Thelephora ganbajun]|uniref:Uncharacterized protein n=1 Tax=Thelephora ganbajun TaxID=370292 RepID=A0ACB6Z2B5_THEGA|nr:hypothetical protein BDM02DRAFT_1374405 [Thelephora ganbajun]
MLTISQLTEKLPPELLEKILVYAPVPDILRMKQVNRDFHDFIQGSPYIKYRIDLFAVGLEENPAVNLSLIDKRRAFDEHCTRWDVLNPIQTWEREIGIHGYLQASGPGVYSFIADRKKFIQFLTLESVPRGIPQREWKLPLPDFVLAGFAINPHADALALVERKENEYSIHLWSMKTGHPHPAAELPIINWHKTDPTVAIYSASITGSRFAMLIALPAPNVAEMVVWDWRTGMNLLDRADRWYQFLEFINEHSFVVLSESWQGDPPQLHIFDTEQGTVLGSIQTSFAFSTIHREVLLCLSSEPCGYVPSPDELTTAPFYSDPSQRILALRIGGYGWHGISLELLLGFARERQGQNIGWDEWRAYIIGVQTGKIRNFDYIWVSGCRLFCTVYDGTDDGGNALYYLRIYDFSHAGRARYLRTLGRPSPNGPTKLISPRLYGYRLPWYCRHLRNATPTTGHDSIVFCVAPDPPSEPSTGILRVWSL